MRPTECPQDAAAYALGVLGAADAFRFEEHLAGCTACAVRVGQFGVVADRLAAYAELLPAGAAPVEAPGPQLLGRLVAAVAAGRRTSRRRRLALVAAAVVLGVGGPAAVAGTQGGPPGRAVQERWTGAGAQPEPAVRAVVTTGAREWGTDVGLEVAARVPEPGVCALVAVGRDGSEQTVSTWSAGGGGGQRVTLRGGAALRPADIDHFEVRAGDGRRLATVTRSAT
ncbi:zf-HC2 domain-containing protein [Streptomyces sp. B1I3]|uniref:zf-HC2 domain-containing protein n=1 Tax=Streptomyces sp. B1I3 TaxID=3042264 RepID=UPI00277D9B9D|nr:zf-HC2 domain-containing protein [Streptomyces sp. B1I3]MDQ0792466.1 hypothetical protein [Streptomyces sp. B1I3]